MILLKIISSNMEDLTRVVILFEMTTRVRFFLSFGPLKWVFIAFKMNIISIRKCVVSPALDPFFASSFSFLFVRDINLAQPIQNFHLTPLSEKKGFCSATDTNLD